uniref:Uncharacterized protein n=1 Tax=Tanacetum cinerariifolium TaxID=118510 RepID=A0A6L2NU66_TANCI|nr:hypothetical protein [Tanacetum cinerariifolium]
MLDKHGSRLYKLENLNIPHQEILQQWMFKDKSYKAHEDHKKLYDALEKSLERDYSDQLLLDLEEARQKKRKRRDVPRTPTSTSSNRCIWCSSKALSLSKSAALAPQYMAWTTSDTRYESAGSYETLELSLTDSLIPDDFILDKQVHVSDDEDSGNDHLSRADSRKGWWKPLPAEERPVTPEPTWTIPSSNVSDVENNWATALASTYQGKQSWTSISKMKAASYPDFDLELLVPERMWIEDVYTYDISAKADLQEHTIAEKDFKNLHPSDFKDLNLLLLQGHLDHLSGSDKRMLSTATQLNLTKLGWDAAGYEFKHDYIIIESPQAVVFPVNNNERKIMWFNEIYKFSNNTLTRILEALAYRVKEFKIKRLNPGMNTYFWTQKDATRSKEFIAAIERRLKTRRIY